MENPNQVSNWAFQNKRLLNNKKKKSIKPEILEPTVSVKFSLIYKVAKIFVKETVSM